MPGWSYTVDETAATIPARQWLDHVAWVEAITEWSACVTQFGRT